MNCNFTTSMLWHCRKYTQRISRYLTAQVSNKSPRLLFTGLRTLYSSARAASVETRLKMFKALLFPHFLFGDLLYCLFIRKLMTTHTTPVPEIKTLPRPAKPDSSTEQHAGLNEFAVRQGRGKLEYATSGPEANYIDSKFLEGLLRLLESSATSVVTTVTPGNPVPPNHKLKEE